MLSNVTFARANVTLEEYENKLNAHFSGREKNKQDYAICETMKITRLSAEIWLHKKTVANLYSLELGRVYSLNNIKTQHVTKQVYFLRFYLATARNYRITR